MDLRKITYLETIYRLKSFTKAAEALYISQPSLSNAIRELEKEMGVTLINRSRPPLRFTQEGERFMWHVYRILNEVRDAEEEMKEMTKQRKQSILFTWPSITANDELLSRIYTEFCSLFPEYGLICLDDTIKGTMTKLLSEDIDLAMVHFPENIDMSRFTCIPITTAHLYAVLPEDHVLAREECISFEMLKSETILTFQPGSLVRTEIEKRAAKVRVPLSIVSVNQIDVAKKLVLDGQGITFVTMDDLFPASVVPGLVFRPLEDPVEFQKGLMMKRGRTGKPAVAKLTEFIQEAVSSARS